MAAAFFRASSVLASQPPAPLFSGSGQANPSPFFPVSGQTHPSSPFSGSGQALPPPLFFGSGQAHPTLPLSGSGQAYPSNLFFGSGQAHAFAPPSTRCFDPGIAYSSKLKTGHSVTFFDGISSARKLVCPDFSVGKNGDQLVNFSREEISLLAEPFDFTLIGKFSAAIPHISFVAPTLKSLPLKGNFNVSFMDTGLLCLRLFLEEDYTYLKLKGALFIADCYMSVLEWSPYVDYAVDSPIVPVWLTLKNVPFMFFQCEALYKISKLLGNPIRVDDATANI